MIPFSRFSRYFVEVAATGSLRKASESLHVSASAIDRQILAAEAELGAPLFERLPSGLRLTAAGEVLLAAIRGWRKDHGRVLAQIADLQGLRRGHVEIAAIDALTEGLIPETVVDLLAAYPQLGFGLRIADNGGVATQVMSGDVDFGLLLDATPNPELAIRATVPVPLGIAMPPDHPLATERTLRLDQTLVYRTILPAAPLIVHRHAEALYARHRIDASHHLVCNNTRMMRSLIRGGAGIGLLSWLDVAADVAAGHLRFVPLSARQARPLRLTLCVAPRRQLSRAALVAIEAVSQRMVRIPAPSGKTP